MADKELSEEIEEEAPEVEAEAAPAPEVEIIAGDPDAGPPDAITIGWDGFCRSPDLAGRGFAEADVLAAIRAGFEVVCDAAAAAGRDVEEADRMAMQALGNTNLAEALAQLSGSESDRAEADAWMALLEDDDCRALASMPRGQADRDATA